MTTVLSDEDGGNAMKLKQKLLNRSNVKEETRSFLNFSRENLSISQADLERGFNKQRFRPNKYTVLSTAALLIALLCFALETWKLRCSLVNSREIEELKRDVKSLKHRFLQQDLLDELKAFEEQVKFKTFIIYVKMTYIYTYLYISLFHIHVHTQIHTYIHKRINYLRL